MPRTRSKSIVSKIANDIPIINNDDINSIHEKIECDARPTTFRQTRSKSVTNIDDAYSNSSVHAHPRTSLAPFGEDEKHTFWKEYLESFNFDNVLKPQDISHINAFHLDSVLGFQSNLHINQKHLVELIGQTDYLLACIDELLAKYKKISKETLEFDNLANELIQRQTQYEGSYNKIHQYLKHFECLDSITQNLSRSGTRLLTQQRQFFITEILGNLDSSLEFIDLHPNFKDCELYKSRFRQCMTRALTMVRNHLNQQLKGLSDSIDRNLKSSRDLTIELLIYNEFSNYLKYNQSQFNELVQELLKRSLIHKEYGGLMNDVLSNYFRIRLRLLKSYMDKTSTINELYKKSDKKIYLVQICQDQISYFKKIIEKEYALFVRFFIIPTITSQEAYSSIWTEFYNFLKNAIDPLYDGIRLVVLKESNISFLCELTTLLQKYYEFEDADNLSSIDTQSYLNSEAIKYGLLFQPLLDDAQNRLIFRIQNYVDNKLMRYKPSKIDLEIANNGGGEQQLYTKEDTSALDTDYEENLFPNVYLPLAKALTILSNIYELINSMVFDDIAHYIVHCCIDFLKNQYLRLAITQTSQLEGQLLYLKNLILVKNQIKNFDIQSIRNDFSIDFTSGLSDIWHSLKQRQFHHTGVSGMFLELAKKSVPKVINNMIDANQEIEMELNNCVSELLTYCSNEICHPILDQKTGGFEQFMENVKIKIPIFYQKISFILNDVIVTRFLIDNLQNLVLVTYEHFYNNETEKGNKIAEKEREKEKTEKKREKLEDLMEVDALYGFINHIIQHLYEESPTQKQTYLSGQDNERERDNN
ncbi:COG3 [Candida oxycetoniae]|uniref:Conserved oligomeric Golgi complex subunit 3 n=1 Tax=Candida oxycetoniae TaxID=497107 RepID=A0AAI9SUM1_9ASCO|nr:COG3 [Candida oxycetoniae]KAI3402998.2 COG3 [Candida oxycetoniae]